MLRILKTKDLLQSKNSDFAIISGWFYENYMAFNPDKFYYFALDFDKPFPGFSLNDITYENAAEGSIKSHWNKYVKRLTKHSVHLQKTSTKKKKSNHRKKIIPLTLNVHAVLWYGSLPWRVVIKKIDKIYKRLLKLRLNDCESTPYDLFSTLNKKTIQQCCIKLLITKMHKYLDGFPMKLIN